MSDAPKISNTEEPALTEYDAERRARLEGSKVSRDPPSVPIEAPEVGLAQKSSGEDAIVRRETEI